MNDFNTHNFLKILDDRYIKYHYEGRWLVIDDDRYGEVNLGLKNLTSLPDYIKFQNIEEVNLSGNLLTSLPDNIKFEFTDNNAYNFIALYDNPLKSLPDNIDEYWDKLDAFSKEYIEKRFPDHWFFEKKRFNL